MGLSQLYDANYFKYYCGLEYSRTEAHWNEFFGTVAQRILVDLAPQTVLDAGCAIGFLVEELRNRKIEAFGFDISDYAIEQVPDFLAEYVKVGSIVDRGLYPPDTHFDLVVCIEVVEHLPPEDADKAIENLCRLGDTILFSSSPDHYDEATHFNVQKPGYWVEKFARNGFIQQLDYDASYITSWAMLFQRETPILSSVLRRYANKNWIVEEKAHRLRNKIIELQNDLHQSIADRRHEVHQRQQIENELQSEKNHKAELVTQLDSLQQQHATEIQVLSEQLEARHADKVQALTEQHEAQLADQMQALTQQHDAQLQKIEQKHVSELSSLEDKVVKLQARENQVRKQLAELEEEYRQELQQKVQENRYLNNILEQSRQELGNLQSEIVDLQQQIHLMRSTKGWQFLERWWRFRKRLFPPQSRRERLYFLIRTSLSILVNQGPFALANRLYRWLRGERRFFHQPPAELPMPEKEQTQSIAPTLTLPAPPSPIPSLKVHHSSKVISAADVLHARFPGLKPVQAFQISQPERRLNMVTDSINSGSLFGGVATAIILSALLAERWNCDLRVVTRTEKAHTRSFGNILSANNITFSKNIEFLFANQADPEAEIPVGSGDVFLTTSWWTTESTRSSFASKRIIYLLQEDERTFYPFDDDHVRCTNVFRDPDITFVLNSKLLFDYLVKEGFESIKQNGYWFEPSWPASLFFLNEKGVNGKKKNFFFYARPNHLRNLFYFGVEAVQTAITRGILSPSEWNFHFVGKDVPNVQLADSARLNIHHTLPWVDYAKLIRQMDLGLSLMYSPHPSYPPIDLAASGSVVVTNSHLIKKDLSQYSDNILCYELQIDALVDGLAEGAKLASDIEQRFENYRNNRMLRNWNTSFEDILEKLSTFRDNAKG